MERIPVRPLTVAVARASARRVAETRVGTRRGSVAAVARAMTDAGVSISKSQLARKLDGIYPFNTDELDALAAVLELSVDELWLDAVHLMTADGHRRAIVRQASDWERAAIEGLESLPPEVAEEVRKTAMSVRRSPAATTTTPYKEVQ